MIRESTAALLRRTVLERQRTGRVPGLHASLVRHGEALWEAGIGSAEVGTDRAPTADDQFLVASNTKTFVATMVMQLRDEGRLDLGDRLADHLPDLRQDLTVRDALSHVSGLQREPGRRRVGHPRAPGRRHPCSGRRPTPSGSCARGSSGTTPTSPSPCWASSSPVSTDARGTPRCGRGSWTRWGMTRTTVGFDGGPQAHGYFVPPWHDVPVPEPVLDLAGTGPAGALASTGRDLARWTAFVADPDPEILDPATLDEMVRPRAVVDAEGWQRDDGARLLPRPDPGRAGRRRAHRRHARPRHGGLHAPRVGARPPSSS